MNGLTLHVPDELLDALALRVAERLAEQAAEGPRDFTSPWLDVAGTAEYAVMTEDAIRAATKRGRLRSYRSETGRVRYLRSDVDDFLHGGEEA